MSGPGTPSLLNNKSHEGRHHKSHPTNKEHTKGSRTLCEETFPHLPEAAVLRKVCLQIWPWLEYGNLDGKQFPYTDIKLLLNDKMASVCLYHLYNVIYAEHLLSLWESEIWVMLGRG